MTTPQPSPLTAEEEAKFRESVRLLGSVDDYGLVGTLHWSNRVAQRLLAALDAARAASPDGRLREAFIAGFRKGQSRTGADEVRIEQLADEYAPPAPAGLDVERLRIALHEAGIGCKPNVPYCRATHRGHAQRIAEHYDRAAARHPEEEQS